MGYHSDSIALSRDMGPLSKGLRQRPRQPGCFLWGEQAEYRHIRNYSEAWGPPQFQERRSRSEKAILGALGEFRGILGAALGIRNSILGIRNFILGMASHDLSNAKT